MQLSIFDGGLIMFFNATAVLPTSYQPNWNTNAVGWWRADQGTTISTGVSQWNDLTAAGNTLTEATGSQQPALVIAGLNNLQSLAFVIASNQQLANTSFPTYTQPFAVYVVGQSNGAGAFAFGTGANGAAGLVRDNGSVIASDTGPLTAQITSGASSKLPFIACAVFNGSSSSLTVNGATTSGTLGTASAATDFYVGSAGTTGYWNKWISEVIIVSGQSAPDTEVLNYLTTKYQPIPLSIAGCTMWLNASQGITLNGSNVSRWQDQTGTADAQQGTPIVQPPYVVSDVAKQPALTFSGSIGSATYMTRGTDTTVANFTIVAVVKVTNSTIGYQLIYGNNAGVIFAVGNGVNKFGIYLGAEVDSTVTVADGNYHVCICSVASATGSVNFMVDGAAAGTGMGTSAYTANSGELGSNAQPTHGSIAEILEYNTVLSTVQMNTLTNYLGAKYGIPVASAPVPIPQTINGLQLWLRADQGITLATGVSQWNDLSGNGNNLSQSTVGLRPAYNATDAAYNNQPTLSFSAVANTVIGGGSITHAQPYTIIFVGDSALAGSSIIESGGTYSGLYTFGPGAGYICFYAGTGQQSNTGITSKSVVAAVFNGASSSIYVNNSSTPVFSANPGSGGLSGAINIGNTGLAGPFTGNIAEVLIYNSVLSTTQLGTIFQYLGSRYSGNWS